MSQLDKLIHRAQSWAEAFDVGVRRHLLEPKHVSTLLGEPRLIIDLVHPQHGQPLAWASVGFTPAEMLGKEFEALFDRRMRAGISSLLDCYLHGRDGATEPAIGETRAA